MKRQIKSNEATHDDSSVYGPILDRIISDEMEQQVLNRSFVQSADRNAEPIVGHCIDARHPVLQGRIRVHFEILGNTFEQWLPTLHGMTFRKSDRVLIQFPQNTEEPIVVGVVDGYAKRPDVSRESGPALTLESDESVKVFSQNGERLLEMYCSESGPVVRLCCKDTSIELPGKLRISAEDIELHAAEGGVRISATDDVVVQGEEIRLN